MTRGGYFIVWERCCRNDDINNIVDPGDTGMVFYLEFPPLSVRNSSPEFVAPNGQYICSNRSFSMPMSATDADGDELRYSLVTPMRGTTSPDVTIGDSISKSSYPLVSWSGGVSLSNVIPGPQPLRIDAAGKTDGYGQCTRPVRVHGSMRGVPGRQTHRCRAKGFSIAGDRL
jgi:hypothetical protein